MSETIAVLRSANDVEAFSRDVDAAGLAFRRVPGLPRFFIFPGIAPGDFPLAGHPAVERVGDGEQQGSPQEQTVTVGTDYMGGGGWAASRVIRRKSPWRAPNHRLPASSTFDCVRTGEGVDIFMIDRGCYVDHPELEGRAVQPFLLDGVAATPLDSSGHGTSCMSIAGGATLGLARGAQLISCKFRDADSPGGSSSAITALGAILDYYQKHASANRPGVLFFSWSGFDNTINAAVSDVIDAGIVCCFPAGNDLEDLDTLDYFPAESDPDAIICGGSNFRDRPYATYNGYGSNYGVPVDIVAPAQAVLVARRPEDTGPYDARNGTSYATPLVAGAVACMLQGYNRLTTRAEVQAVKARLLENATQGELKPAGLPGGGGDHAVPDRLLYLDPRVPFELIPGLSVRPA